MAPANATCQISIRGCVRCALDRLSGRYVAARRQSQGGEVRTTTLVGKPPDLPAFIGMLSLLSDLGFPGDRCEYHELMLEESAPMTTLTVFKFPTAEGAQQLEDTLLDLQKQQRIEVQDAAIVTWPRGQE